MRTVVLAESPLEALPELAAFDVVVTPNDQAARALGVGSADLSRLLPSRPRVAPEPVAQRALREAVARCGLPQPERYARLLQPSLRRVLRSGASAEHLDSGVRPRQLARIIEAYREALAPCIDRSEALRQAVELGKVAPRRLLVYGYGRLDSDEIAFLDAVAGDGSRLILPYAAEPLLAESAAVAEALAGRSWRIETSECTQARLGDRLALRFAGRAVAAEAVCHAYADPEAEVRGVLGQLKQRLAAGARPDRVVLVARDERRYAPLVGAVAAEYGIRVRPCFRVPLSETRLGAWLALLLEVLAEDRPFEPTLRLLGARLVDEVSSADLAGPRRERAAGARWSEHGLGLAPPAPPDQMPLAAWARWLGDLLANLDLRRRLARWPRELQAIEALRIGLGHLDSGERAVPARSLAAEVAELLEATTVDHTPGRGGVELHTPLALYGARFDTVFVLGAADGFLPAPVADDPYLDFREREALVRRGLPLETASEAARRERLSVFLMLQTVERELVVSRPRQIDGRPVGPSVWIERLGQTGARPASVACCRAELPARRVRTDAAVAAALAIEQRRESSAPPDGHDGVIDRPVPWHAAFSVTQLTALGQCPFRWFAERPLRLAEAEEGLPEPDARLRGSLAHAALEGAGRAALAAGRPADPATWLAALPDALEAAVADPESELGVLSRLPHWQLLRDELLGVLAAAVTAETFLEPDAVPAAFELGFDEVWHGLRLRGVIDRIDHAPDGAVLFDYKLRSGAGRPKGVKGDDGKANRDLQLTVYGDIYACLTGGAVLAAHYLNLVSAERPARPKDGAQVDGQAFAAEVRRRLAEGAFEVDPDAARAACQYCELAVVCRVGPRVDRKRAAR